MRQFEQSFLTRDQLICQTVKVIDVKATPSKIVWLLLYET
jgi:hypothetical protein